MLIFIGVLIGSSMYMVLWYNCCAMSTVIADEYMNKYEYE